ncbi:chymotrypsin-2-like isoform X2 [Agrilus planipennis]|uniref:Chymotrypsin-2-like isoform X2 n=1 Tax=Agrilus planipennis TaxID=224129 RepID=A0A1W4WUX0_AGRPL|nr:chymotrypsin-2-like isoform X2 [Agrilus planipennis]
MNITSFVVFLFLVNSSSETLTDPFYQLLNSNGKQDPNEPPPNSYPFLVSVQKILVRHHGHLCGGTIISERYVLTATHCVLERKTQYKVAAGIRNLKFSGIYSQKISVQEIIRYSEEPSTWPFGKGRDISILKLKSPLIWNDFVKPVNIPLHSDQQFVGNVEFPGWGELAPLSVTSSQVLHVSQLKLWTFEECSEYFKNFTDFFYVTQYTICTDGPGSISDCWGDLGGPLLKDGVQIGISSWNFNPCGEGTPLVFTSTYMFIDWIKNYV